MIDLELLFKEKTAIPLWFRDHPIFKEIKQTHKIFPTIGLPNFSIVSELKNDETAQLVRNLCSTLRSSLDNAWYHFDSIVYHNKQLEPQYKPILHLISQFISPLKKASYFVLDFKKRNGLYIPKNIEGLDKEIFAKKGESLFKVYNKYLALLQKDHKYVMPALDKMQAFKDFSASNVDGKMNVVFSSDGVEGAWDLLTMSMRGINSCQSWGGQYHKCTIGSVLDPFTGIIYLTSGTKTPNGTKMLRRCVVRFIVDSFTKRPCIFLEYMYPGGHAATMKAFKDAIYSKIGDRFPIITYDEISKNHYYVPYNQVNKLLSKYSDQRYINVRGSHNQYGIFPYRDTYMEIKVNTERPFDKTSIKQDIMADLTTTLTDNGIVFSYVSIITHVILTELLDKINDCPNAEQYIRQVCLHYLANKSKISNILLNEIKTLLKTKSYKSILVKKSNSTKEKSVKTKSVRLKSAKKSSQNELASFIEENIMTIISQNLKENWKYYIKPAAKKSKAKSILSNIPF